MENKYSKTKTWISLKELLEVLQFGSDPKKIIKFLLDQNLIKTDKTLSGFESMSKSIKFTECRSTPIQGIDRMLVRSDIIPFLLLEKGKEFDKNWDQDGLKFDYEFETDEFNKQMTQIESLSLLVKGRYDKRVEWLVHLGLKI